MPSPFPGMDPYLEQSWGDVHSRLATYAADQLRPMLPPGLRARIEESVAVEADDPGKGPTYYPDVLVREVRPTPGRTAVAEPRTATEPILVPRRAEPRTRRAVRIVTADGARLVTAVEFLSPSNKVGNVARKEYRDKQRDYIRSGVGLVEIDLIRSGRYVSAAPLTKVPAEYRTDCSAVVVRGWNKTVAEFYPVSLRHPLPVVRVPLRESDPDATLDIQALVDLIYENGGYDSTDYRQPLEPDLEPEDEAWAEALLKAAGKR